MRILHIMAGRGLGGAETYAADVMLSLHRAGIDQCVVMSDKAPRFKDLQAAGIRLAPQILSFPFRPWQKYRLKKLIAREQPDVIHCWMRRAASLMQRTEDGRQRTEKKNLSSVLRPPSSVIGWFGGYYDPKHFRRCTHFVGVTRDIVAHMVKNNVPAARTFFIPTFPDIADLPPVNRTDLNTPEDAKVLLTLSRLHPKKGLGIFLHALAELPDCYAWIAGDGPLRQSLEKLARQLGVMNRVRFLGWRTDRAALLRAANVCVLPSRYEPFGTVILEAWAAGVPLVATKSAGPLGHVDDGVNGLLVPIDDSPQLVQALRRALDDDDLRADMIAAGRAAYEKNYTREAVTGKWIEFYEQLKTGAA